jgi:DNA-binding transcriptional LysR family regulator
VLEAVEHGLGIGWLSRALAAHSIARSQAAFGHSSLSPFQAGADCWSATRATRSRKKQLKLLA